MQVRQSQQLHNQTTSTSLESKPHSNLMSFVLRKWCMAAFPQSPAFVLNCSAWSFPHLNLLTLHFETPKKHHLCDDLNLFDVWVCPKMVCIYIYTVHPDISHFHAVMVIGSPDCGILQPLLFVRRRAGTKSAATSRQRSPATRNNLISSWFRMEFPADFEWNSWFSCCLVSRGLLFKNPNPAYF